MPYADNTSYAETGKLVAGIFLLFKWWEEQKLNDSLYDIFHMILI